MEGHKPEFSKVGSLQETGEIPRHSRTSEAPERFLRRPGAVGMNLDYQVGVVRAIQLLPLERLAYEQGEQEGTNPKPDNRIEWHKEHPPLAAQTPEKRWWSLRLLKCS
jgi:hypothetical protein